MSVSVANQLTLRLLTAERPEGERRRVSMAKQHGGILCARNGGAHDERQVNEQQLVVTVQPP